MLTKKHLWICREKRGNWILNLLFDWKNLSPSQFYLWIIKTASWNWYLKYCEDIRLKLVGPLMQWVWGSFHKYFISSKYPDHTSRDQVYLTVYERKFDLPQTNHQLKKCLGPYCKTFLIETQCAEWIWQDSVNVPNFINKGKWEMSTYCFSTIVEIIWEFVKHLGLSEAI